MRNVTLIVATATIIGGIVPLCAASLDATVVRVEPASNAVWLTHGPVHDYDVGMLTKRYRAATSGMLGDLSPGERVEVTFDEAADTPRILEIRRSDR